MNAGRSWSSPVSSPTVIPSGRSSWRAHSASTRRRTRFDVQLAMGQGGVTKKCWIRIPAVQPLMKSDLEDQSGTLDEALLTQVQGRLAQYLGLVG